MVKTFHLHISGTGIDIAESVLPRGTGCQVERMVKRKKTRLLEWVFWRGDWPQICCFRY